jgi:hypothetical protein
MLGSLLALPPSRRAAHDLKRQPGGGCSIPIALFWKAANDILRLPTDPLPVDNRTVLHLLVRSYLEMQASAAAQLQLLDIEHHTVRGLDTRPGGRPEPMFVWWEIRPSHWPNWSETPRGDDD